MTSLITGITGFVGGYLTERLRKAGQKVAGIDQWPSCRLDNVDYAQINILDTGAISQFMAKCRPSRIYHLAGISYLPDADATPRHALETNIIGLIALLDAMRRSCPDARMLVVGSSKEYGSEVISENLKESMHPDPTDFYGISKYAAEMLGRQYVRQFDLDIRFSRSFNHTGPGQSPRFVCSDWAKQVAEIELGKAPPRMTIGNTDQEIDFSDVRDVVGAYFAILEKGRKGEVYNVCSGSCVSLDRILRYLLEKSSRRIAVQHIEQKVRAHKASSKLAGDNTRLRAISWKQRVPIEKTLDDIYAWWMKELKRK